MRHGLRVVLVFLGIGLLGFVPAGQSGELSEHRLGFRVQPIFLLTRADVQADLALSPNQIVELNHVGALLYQKAQALRGKKGPAVNEARREIDAELVAWLGSHLTRQQLDRLQEIDYQWEGAAAMVRPIVVDYLRLTPDQIQKLNQYLVESIKRRDRASWTTSDHINLTREAVALLSEKQKELWSNLLGQPCRFLSIGEKSVSPNARSERRSNAGPGATR